MVALPAPSSQAGLILAAMRAGRQLTPLDALRDYGCLRLAPRIWDLRQAGFVIKDQMVQGAVSGQRFKRYWMEFEPEQLPLF